MMKMYYLSAVISTLLILPIASEKCVSEIDAEIEATLSQISAYRARID